jgi:MFS family permease
MTSRVESFFDHGVVNRGWLTTIAGTIGLTLGPSTLTLVSFGVFVRPLQQEFGRTLGQTTFAATIISYAAMVVALVQGMLTDRFGSRVLIVASIPIFALSYASLCFLPRNLAVYYAFWIIIPVCAIGIWPLTYLRATATWFDRRMGLALGSTNSGIGSIIIPPLAGVLVVHYGWRNAYGSLAAIALVVTWPVTLAFLRKSGSVGPQRQSITVKWGAAFSEAAKTSTFAITAIVFFILGGLSAGLVVLQVPMLIEAGIAPTVSAWLASIVGMSMIVGRIGTGYLLDYLHAARVLMWFILASSFAAVVFAIGVTMATAPIAATMIGLIVGAEFDALSYIIPRYYGYRSFGTTYGGVYAVFQLGVGLGIAAVGFSRDWLGSFRPSMCALAVLTLLAGLLFSRLGPYRFPAGKLGAATAGTESASGAGNRG